MNPNLTSVNFCLNTYNADGVPQYWTEDSTSVNIIVKNMQNYNTIVQNLELLFTDANDEILADDEDDNIIVNSLSLPLMHKDSIISAIRIAADDIAFFTYSKLVNVDTSNMIHITQSYFELYNATFLSS